MECTPGFDVLSLSKGLVESSPCVREGASVSQQCVPVGVEALLLHRKGGDLSTPDWLCANNKPQLPKAIRWVCFWESRSRGLRLRLEVRAVCLQTSCDEGCGRVCRVDGSVEFVLDREFSAPSSG